jgi:hypothetical protein
VPRLLEIGATDVHTPLAVWCRDASSSEDWCLRLATAWRESAQ